MTGSENDNRKRKVSSTRVVKYYSSSCNYSSNTRVECSSTRSSPKNQRGENRQRKSTQKYHYL